MPLILTAVFITLILMTITPAGAVTCAVGIGVIFGINRWSEIEAEHKEAGTPWQYRPTLWVILFLLFIGLLIYGKLS